MKDGGPAFPVPVSEEMLPIAIGGMSLRDWFAGMALQGLCVTNEHTSEPGTWNADYLAHAAFRFADAMIAQREKEEKP